MSMKSKLMALTAMGLALGTTGYGRRSLMLNEETETEQERKERLAKAEVERNIRNGLNLFTFHNNGETVEIWALNQKNADRKYNNLKNKLNQ